MKEQMYRRLVHMLLLLVVFFCVMGARLAWVQLGFPAAGAALAREAVRQRTDGLVVDTGRGRFLDRSGRLLTGPPIRSLAAFPDYGMPRGSVKALELAAAALDTPADALEVWLRELKEPAIWRRPGSHEAAALTDDQARAVEKAGLLGVAVLPYRDRFPRPQSALHAIGYLFQSNTGELTGGSGLEKSMDRLLQGVGPTVVSQLTDAARRPLGGLGLRTAGPGNPHFPLLVKTTLDRDIQRETEAALLAAGVRQGAAVVLDVHRADILAMVSLPALNPGDIGAPSTDVRNHAVTAFPPGSVFKIVTLAAALESGEAVLDRRFRCNGEYGRYGLKCWRKEGHGDITLQEAFAESCNVIFAALADKMDPAWIQITGERLGLGRRVGWSSESFMDGKPLRLLEEEQPGMIFTGRKAASDGGVRTGSGIGQRDVRVTPLQAANLAVTLLHGGRVMAPRLVTEILYTDGTSASKLPPQASPSKYGEIRTETADAVLAAMRSVVTQGTARAALAASRWPLAGKSGTAELAGKQKARNDHWFVGYGPAGGKPRYAVAVLIEDQPAGLRNRAASLFGDVMERLHLLEKRRLPSSAEPVGKATP